VIGDFTEALQAARSCIDNQYAYQIEAMQIARALVDMNARMEDLELMARAWTAHARIGWLGAKWAIEVHRDCADDGTGLPVLTDEARAALRAAEGRETKP